MLEAELVLLWTLAARSYQLSPGRAALVQDMAGLQLSPGAMTGASGSYGLRETASSWRLLLSSLTGKGQEDVGYLAGSVNHDLTDLGQGLRLSHTCVLGPCRSLISGWQDSEMSTEPQAKEDPVEGVGWGSPSTCPSLYLSEC